MKFILTATKQTGNDRLHLINRNIQNTDTPYVVCWNYYPKHRSWNWGTYCCTLKEALYIFNKKIREFRFDDVFEGYVDMERRD